jgi:predicted N-acetyltransferase YhbS
MNYTIRLETPDDFHIVESISRDAFWNLYVPGCNEHLIINTMRTHQDFIQRLAFVIEVDNKIIGNIMFTKSHIITPDKQTYKTITIGPISISPDFSGQGYGTILISYALEQARKLNYKAVILYGYPSFYTKLGFLLAANFNISRSDGVFAQALLAIELFPNALTGISGNFYESELYHLDDDTLLEQFDQNFPPKKKSILPSQAEFILMVDAIIE